MHIIWLMLLIPSLIGAMENVVPGNFDYKDEIDSDEISDIAMSIYFDNEDPEVFQMVFPKVKQRLKDINTLPEVLHRAINKDLKRIKESNHRHSYHSYQQHYPDLHIYLNKILYKCMKDAFKEEREYNIEVERRANRYKIAAITGAVAAAILTASGTLIVHFVQPECPVTN